MTFSRRHHRHKGSRFASGASAILAAFNTDLSSPAEVSPFELGRRSLAAQFPRQQPEPVKVVYEQTRFIARNPNARNGDLTRRRPTSSTSEVEIGQASALGVSSQASSRRSMPFSPHDRRQVRDDIFDRHRRPRRTYDAPAGDPGQPHDKRTGRRRCRSSSMAQHSYGSNPAWSGATIVCQRSPCEPIQRQGFAASQHCRRSSLPKLPHFNLDCRLVTTSIQGHRRGKRRSRGQRVRRLPAHDPDHDHDPHGAAAELTSCPCACHHTASSCRCYHHAAYRESTEWDSLRSSGSSR